LHIILVETSSVRGFDIVAEMVEAGIEVTFVSENPDGYLGKPGAEKISLCARKITVPGLAGADDLAVRLRGQLGDVPPSGVICRDEVFLHSAACLGRDLGVPHEDLETARLLGDKAATRERLDKAGLGGIAWREAVTEAEGLAAVAEFGPPVVIKPTAGGWSVGVTVAYDEDGARRALSEALPGPGPGPEDGPEEGAHGTVGTGPRLRALVEEYAVGRHVSAELLVQDGHIVFLGFAERLPAPPGVTAELGGHFPARFDGMGAARDYACRVVRELGIRASAVHMELLITPTGPELIEVNGRVAGHVVTQQMSLALGRSIAMDLVALATGEPLTEAGVPLATVALRQLWSPVDGTVRSAAETMNLPPEVVQCEVGVAPGDSIRALKNNHDRFGYVLARGPSAQAAGHAAEAAVRTVVDGLGIAPGRGSGTQAQTVPVPRQPLPQDGRRELRDAPGSDHLLLLAGPASSEEVSLARQLEAVAAVTRNVSVIWAAGEEHHAGDEEESARGVWRQGFTGRWYQASTPDEARRLLEDLRADGSVAGALTLGPCRDADAAGPEPFPNAAGHTVLVLAGPNGATPLAVLDHDAAADRADGGSVTVESSCPSRLNAPAREASEQSAVAAAAGETGVVRCFFPLSSSSSGRPHAPAVLAGIDAATLELYDAVHVRSLLTLAASDALGRRHRPVERRERAALQRTFRTRGGSFRVLEATTRDELRDRAELFSARVPFEAGSVHPGERPTVWMRCTVVAENAVGAGELADRLERACVFRTEPLDRTHVLILDRVGPATWTDGDGMPLFPPDRYRVSVLSSSARTGGDGAAETDFAAHTDVFDHDATARLAQAVHRNHPVDRVATLSERLLEPAASLRSRLGAGGDTPEEARQFVDKAAMKAIAQGAGIPCAAGRVAATEDDVTELFDRHGAVVVKPRSSSGSQGVGILDTPTAVEGWLRESFQPMAFLCEEFVPGDLCHIDAVVFGDVREWDVSVYVRDTLALRRGLPLSSVTTADPVLRIAADRLLASVTDAWRIGAGVLHVEGFFHEGALTFCELAGRPGGAGVSEAFAATRGVNLDHAKLLLDAGGDPRVLRRDPVAEYAGWTVHYSPGGTLVEFDDSAVAGKAYHRSVSASTGRATKASSFSGSGLSTHVFADDSHDVVRRLVNEAESGVRIVTDNPTTTEGARI